MVVAQNQLYRIEYGGKKYAMRRKRLVSLSNQLAESWKTSDADRRRKLWRILMQINWQYIRASTYKFASEMDREDWESWVIRILPNAISNYSIHLGNFHTYLASWKRAAFGWWQDERDSIRLPQNQRLTLSRMRKKVAEIERKRANDPKAKDALSESEMELMDKIQVSTTSLSTRLEDGDGTLEDAIAGEDARDNETLGLRYSDIWVRIKDALEPREYSMFLWHHHEDYRLNLSQIGERVGLSRERVRQIIEKSRAKLAKRLGKFSDWMGK